MSTPTRLYMAVNTTGDDRPDDEEYDGVDVAPTENPDGWDAYSLERWGEVRPFFFPSTKRVYLSRSAAQERADLIRRWGGTAEVIECTPRWQTVEHANRERQKHAISSRIQKLKDALAVEQDKYEGLTSA